MGTKQFKEFLKVAKQVVASGRDVVSKSVSLEVQFDKVICRATDFDVYLEMEIELLNTENVLNETVIIPLDIILKLVKAVPASTVIMKEDDQIKIHLVGGNIPVETFNVDGEKFKFASDLTASSSVPAEHMREVIRDFGPIITAAVSPAQRRIIFEAGIVTGKQIGRAHV